MTENSRQINISGQSWRAIAVFLCALVVLCAGGYKLDEISITNDEATTLFVSSHESIRSVVASDRDTYPPLYYVLVHLFLRIYPEDKIFAVRVFSLLCGVLCIPLFYTLCLRIMPSFNPLPAVAFLATSELLIYFSREGRCYTFILLLALISSMLVVRIIRRDDLKSWVLYTLVSLTLFYTHYFTVFFLLSQALFLMLTGIVEKKRNLLIHLSVSGCVLGILFLPLYPDIAAYATAQRTPLYFGPNYDVSYLQYILRTLTYGWRKLQIIFIALYLLGMWCCYQREKNLFVHNLILFCLPLALAPAFFALVVNSYFRMKYVIYVLPFFLIPVSIGFLYLKEVSGLSKITPYIRRSAAIAFFFAVASVMVTDLKLSTVTHYLNNKTHSNWKRASHFIDTHAAPDDALGFYPNFIHKAYNIYSSTEVDTFLFGPDQWISPAERHHVRAIMPETLDRSTFESSFKHYRRFWLVALDDYRASNRSEVDIFLRRYFEEKVVYPLGRIQILLYQQRRVH